MISTKPLHGGKKFDVILVTGDVYVDHPFCGTAVIARVLEARGYSVGIIEAPDWAKDEDFKRLGEPRLFFGVSSGAIESMLDNYTPMLRRRETDEHKRYVSQKPDRAVIVYSNMIRKNFRRVPLVIGGVEASLRRFAHYDYWSNSVRKPIIMDAGADVLVYGSAEYAVAEIAKRLDHGKTLDGIQGTCVIRDTAPEGFKLMPSFEDVSADKAKFCEMQMMLSNDVDLAQMAAGKCVLQHKAHRCTPWELDAIYELPYTRDIPPNAKYLEGMQFSVVTHRGCIGNCSFCSIALHQGCHVVSRTEQSILMEISRLTKHKDFKGFIDDLGGPSANMYGMDCRRCGGECIRCTSLDRSHAKLLRLLRKARQIKGVRRVFVRSGIRYDLAVDSEEYIREIAQHHTSGYLKIAPEHCSESVLKLMNKSFPGKLEKFVSCFERASREGGRRGQCLKYYLVAAHPGSSAKENTELAAMAKRLGKDAIIQVFTPTPMSMSACMYYTGMDPRTGERIYVPHTFRERKDQKEALMEAASPKQVQAFRAQFGKRDAKAKKPEKRRGR